MNVSVCFLNIPGKKNDKNFMNEVGGSEIRDQDPFWSCAGAGIDKPVLDEVPDVGGLIGRGKLIGVVVNGYGLDDLEFAAAHLVDLP